MIIQMIVFLNSTVVDTVTEVSTNLRVDCEQSLFFSRFSERNAHARERWAEKQRDARNEGASSAPSVTRVVIYVSQAFCSTDQEKRETARSLIFAVVSHIQS